MVNLFQLTIIGIAFNSLVNGRYKPEQIHISRGYLASGMNIIWSTQYDTGESIVEYGLHNDQLILTTSGLQKALVNTNRTQFIHTVRLNDLEPRTYYDYRVGCSLAWSRSYTFRTFPKYTNVSWSPKVAIIGDLGLANGLSLPSLLAAAKRHEYNAYLHMGDIGYDLYSKSGAVGDEYLRKIEPLAAEWPYMVIPGNHEYFTGTGDRGKNYNARFRMPGGNSNSYTWSLGPLRFVALNTEVFFENGPGNQTKADAQIRWLNLVLDKATRHRERAKRPWIVVLLHRPIYCSNDEDNRCPGGQLWIRKGNKDFTGLEDMFYNYNVDLVVGGHNHHYERSLPVYDKVVRVSNDRDPYANPLAPVYIVSGAAGNKEIKDQGDPFSINQYPWSAMRRRDIGYSRLAANATHLHFQQLASLRSDRVIDDMTIWKDY